MRYGLIVSVLMAWGAHAWASDAVWKYVDADGVLHFSSEPIHQGSQMLLQSAPSQRSALAPAVSQPQAARTFAVLRQAGRMDHVTANLQQASQQHGVDYRLLKAVIAAESAFNPRAVSPKGAVGLMQIMPATAVRYGVRPSDQRPVAQQLLDPELNIMTGTRYLADLLRMFDGRLDLALAAYNAGEGAVKRAGHRIPNFRETQEYVRRVMSFYEYLLAVGP